MLITAVCFGVFAAFSQEKDCRKFHNGTFTNINEETGITTLIERKDNMQTETTDGGKNKAVFNLKWTNDCSYTLRPTRSTLKQHPGWPESAVFSVEITETGEDGYRQVSSTNFSDTKITNDIKKVK